MSDTDDKIRCQAIWNHANVSKIVNAFIHIKCSNSSTKLTSYSAKRLTLLSVLLSQFERSFVTKKLNQLKKFIRLFSLSVGK